MRFSTDYLLALLAGALLALSFPRYGHPALGWIALVPLLLALSGWNGRTGHAPGRRPRRAFALGLVAGTTYFVGTLYWTATVVQEFGGLATPVAIVAMLLLALYLALFPAIASLITARLVTRAGASGVLVAAAPWVATEFFRGYLLGGFPWVPLGNSQVTVLPIAQLASALGVYGVSGLVAFVSSAIAYAVLATGRARMKALAAAALVVFGVGAWGAWRIRDGSLTGEGNPIRIGLVQGNISQDDKWDPAEARRIFTTHIAMTREAVRNGADLVIWPESSTPFMFEEDNGGAETIRALARELRVPILFGSDQIERGPPPRLYNSAFLVSPDGRTPAVYRKIHLVPFGEFIPMKSWLFFVSPIVESLAEFAPGASMVLLPVGNHLASTAICYEVVYPSLVRQAVEAGSELLTTITNDAWYDRSSAPYQHFALASMRSIEQGRYLARAANTGISGVVDPYGRVVAQSAIFEQRTLVEDARFLTRRTIYSVVGDAVAYVAMALTASALIVVGRSSGNV
ncbi:MAG: apolipoprotein N-acyltransferase [Vicinamibacterales bacterium]